MTGDQLKFHSERAAAELELAIGARDAKAAKAHFGLSALHLERLGRLIEGARAGVSAN
jgi:hypothetical protein